MKKIFIILTAAAISILFIYLIYREGTLPVDKTKTEMKIFVVRKGEGLNAIIQNLAGETLIRNRVVFYIVVKQLGIEKSIQAGDFRLSPSMNVYDIAKTLTHGTLDVWVTVVEGLRKEEIARIISKNFDMPESEFTQNAREGYLFPDTYLIPKTATAEMIVSILRDNFEKKYGSIPKTNTSLTKHQIVTLASLVEREVRRDEDRLTVANIIVKRIENDWPLQIDATVQYAVGYQPNEKTWWKKNLTLEDLAIKSTYNTYKITGLPPGPIGNPGLASLKAAANADGSTLYWYYISDKTGAVHYAQTLEEHNANIQKYLR